MRFLFLNHIQNAKDSLRANRMRTFLTITGVTIGVTSIVAILALAHGASSIVTQQVDALGGNIAVVRPGQQESTDLNELANYQAHRTFETSTLSLRDIDTIKTLDHVDAVAPIMILSGTLKGDSTAPPSTTLIASTPELLTINDISMRSGQFSTSSTQPSAAIGTQLSINLFGTEESLGKMFTIRGVQFRVSGVFDRQKDPVNFNGVDFDNTALISVEQAQRFAQLPQIQQINVRADSVANLERVVIETNKTLLLNHNNEQDFSVLTGDSIAQPTSQLFLAIAGVTAAIASISLLVGGIGIMNIMLVNVAERTREIGIRKALGASSTDIVWQFLIESLIMGIIGGLLGIALGFGCAFCLSLFLTFDPVFNWTIPAIGLAVSAIIGTVFGLYPAYRAARKNPIESLRQQS